MKRSVIIVASLLAASMVMAADKPVKVNGVEISPQQVDEVVKNMATRGEKDTPELRDHIKDSLVIGVLLEQEAQKHGYEKAPEFASRMKDARQRILIGMLQRDWEKQNPVTPADIKAEYDKQKALLGSKEYEVAHIVVKTQPEAQAVIAQLNKGSDFGALAKSKSTDQGSANNKGSLGWINPAQFPKNLGAALPALAKGQYTKTPIQSADGWHVLKVTDTRPVKLPPLDSVKDQIEQSIKQQRFQDYVKQLHDKAKIE